MFLQEIPVEYQKDFFVLAKYLVDADGVFAKQEKAMMEQYFREMQVEPFDISGDWNEAVSHLKEVDLKLRKKLLFEYTALCLVDDEYNEAEQKKLGDIAAAWNISISECDTYKAVATQVLQAYQKTEQLFR